MIDLHCHLLPGIDDGPPDLDTALSLASAMAGLGFRTVCCTPHRPWGETLHPSSELEQRRRDFQTALDEEGIPLDLQRGAEHHSSMLAQLLQTGGLVTYPRSDSFLLEFPLSGLPPRLDELLFLCQVKGRIPVIAHVEKYPEVQRQGPEALEPLRRRGCFFLCNLKSLTGAAAREQQAAVRALLEQGWVDAFTTDLHETGSVRFVAEGLADLELRIGPTRTRRLLCQAPAEIAGLGASGGGRGEDGVGESGR